VTDAVVIRLTSTAAAEGRLDGNVEVVETGETFEFRSDGELLAVLRSVSGMDGPDRSSTDEKQR